MASYMEAQRQVNTSLQQLLKSLRHHKICCHNQSAHKEHVGSIAKLQCAQSNVELAISTLCQSITELQCAGLNVLVIISTMAAPSQTPRECWCAGLNVLFGISTVVAACSASPACQIQTLLDITVHGCTDGRRHRTTEGVALPYTGPLCMRKHAKDTRQLAPACRRCARVAWGRANSQGSMTGTSCSNPTWPFDFLPMHGFTLANSSPFLWQNASGSLGQGISGKLSMQ